MTITALKQQVKNANRVSVFLDGKYSVSLTLDQVLDEKIKKGIDVDEQRLKQLKKLSDDGKLKQRALEWLMNRPHSEREFRDYMYRKQADKGLTEVLIEEFIEKKYLDNATFAKWFAEQRRRKNKSDREISSELASKGVDRVTIQSIVTDLESDETGALKEKINKLKTRTRYQDEKKLITYLIGKGFRYSDIRSALNDEDS
ncbi:MAG: regulatory protein [Candidatus Saccharimonadales bacterium]|jgi:regulatory protein